MCSLHFTFDERFRSALTRGRGELSIALRATRFLRGEDILRGEGLTPAKATPPAPEPGKPFFRARFPAATGVLVTQSSGRQRQSGLRSWNNAPKARDCRDRKVSERCDGLSIVRAQQIFQESRSQVSVYRADARNQDSGWASVLSVAFQKHTEIHHW
jgi:hypothetical protein